VTADPARRVAVALPGFRSAIERSRAGRGQEPDLPATRWLASRGRRAAGSSPDWRAWLLSPFGPGAEALRRCPPGASVRALATGRRDDGCWACAQPVHLVTALDHLRLAPLAELGLGPAEAESLRESIATALADSGYVLRWAGSEPWTLECPTEIECDTVEPADAENRDLRDCLPAGRDAQQVRKLMNELQMLLHEHPANIDRAERGLAPVNGVWLWGFGGARAVEPATLPALATDDAWLRGLWRLCGGSALPLASARQSLECSDRLLVAAASTGTDPGAQLTQWDTTLVEPLAAALRRGSVRGASLLLGDVAYSVEHGDRFAFWRRRRPWQELLA
jgi:hypothetical protein